MARALADPSARPIRYRRNNHPPTRRLNMTAHIDTLKEWWSEAEEGVIEKGDTVSNWFGGETTVYVAAERARRQNTHTRILARAPKPKPAWHDALAVMARCSNAPEGHREPFIRSEATPDVWIGEGGCGHTDDLRDVTPLIEAKVTDEAMQRVFNALDPAVNKRLSMTKEDEEYVRYIVTAALGLETE